MTDPYQTDLEKFTLKRFRHILETGEVLPGRKILQEKIPERFTVLESMGIKHLKDLIDALKTKAKIDTFAQKSGLPQDYLVILRREANHYIPKPFNLNKIPGVASVHVERLAAIGIKNTQQLCARAKTRQARTALSKLAGVPSADLLELVKLLDLARINGVGPVFARLFCEAGADTLEKIAQHSPAELFAKLRAINKVQGYTQVMASLKDVAYCIETAKELPEVIEY